MSLRQLLEQCRIDMPVLLLLLVVMSSAIAVIYSKHASRNEFIVLQKLEAKRDKYNEDWGKLLLEQSTWASPARVEQLARSRLDMIVPAADMSVVVKP